METGRFPWKFGKEIFISGIFREIANDFSLNPEFGILFFLQNSSFTPFKKE